MYAKAYVEITNICNMRCSFCHGHHRAPRRMTEAEFARVLEQLKPQTGYLYYHLMGEPLTHPHLPLFLRMAEAAGFRSILTTNGTLLRARESELLNAPLHKVSISVHSFETGSDEALLSYLGEIVAFAEKASAKGIIVVLRLWNRGFDEGKNDRIFQYLRSHLAGEWAENTRGIRIHDKLHLEWGDRFAWPDLTASIGDGKVTCYGLIDHFGILADGTVVPCCMDSEGVISLGNLFETELAEILSSPRARTIAEGFRCHRAAEELCRRCGYAKRFLRYNNEKEETNP